MYKIPKRLVVGYRDISNKPFAFPTEIRISNRTKNSPFKIEKENSWLNKIDSNQPRIQLRNEFRAGFKLNYYTTESRSRTNARTSYYLWQDDFKGQLTITSENLFNLIQNCTIIKNEIQEKLIYDGTEFITEEMMQSKLETAEGNDADFIKEKEEMKSRKVLARNLVPGSIYSPPPTKKKITSSYYIVYLGKVVDDRGAEYFVTRHVYKFNTGLLKAGHMGSYNVNQTYNYNTGPSNPNQIIKAPGEILNAVLTSRGYSNGIPFTYKGSSFVVQNYSPTKYLKTSTSLYAPKTKELSLGIPIKNINLYDGYGKEELDMIEYLLLNNNSYNYKNIKAVSTDAVTQARANLAAAPESTS